MDKEHTTIRMWKQTLRNLRMIYALTGASMVEILDRVVEQELARIQAKSHDQKSL